MKSAGKPSHILVIAALVLFPLLLSVCSGSSDTTDNAVPSFCPPGYGTRLDIAPGGNTEPRAYFQELVTTEGVDLDITLLACDPDSPQTAAGMTWSVLTGPYSGMLSSYSGTYTAQPYQVTYIPALAGTDQFYFVCFDAEGAISNVAEIRINVTPAPLTGQQLYFGGRDENSRYHLWHHDGVSPISTVSGSAQFLTVNGLRRFDGGHPDQDWIIFRVTDTSGENDHLVGFNPGTQAFQRYTQLDGVGELVQYGSVLYTSGEAAGTSTAYLWSGGSGGWNPVPGTENLRPYNLEVFGGKLYFAGDAGGGNIQLMSYDNNGGILATESSAVSSLWPRNLTVCDGRLYFNGYAAGDEYLWATDGITIPATIAFSVTSPGNMICFNNELYFTALGSPASTMPAQLWSIDSGNSLTRWTSNSTADFMNVFSETYPAVTGSMLYLRGTDDSYTNWIWAHDGSSPLSTVTGSDGLFPFFTTVYDGRLFFNSSWIPGPAYGYDNLGYYDPGTGAIAEVSNINMGLNSRYMVVYPP